MEVPVRARHPGETDCPGCGCQWRWEVRGGGLTRRVTRPPEPERLRRTLAEREAEERRREPLWQRLLRCLEPDRGPDPVDGGEWRHDRS